MNLGRAARTLKKKPKARILTNTIEFNIRHHYRALPLNLGRAARTLKNLSPPILTKTQWILIFVIYHAQPLNLGRAARNLKITGWKNIWPCDHVIYDHVANAHMIGVWTSTEKRMDGQTKGWMHILRVSNDALNIFMKMLRGGVEWIINYGGWAGRVGSWGEA